MNRFNFFNRKESPKHGGGLTRRRLVTEPLEERILMTVAAGSLPIPAETALYAGSDPTNGAVEITIVEITTLDQSKIDEALAGSAKTIRFADALRGKTLVLTQQIRDITRSVTLEGNGVHFQGGGFDGRAFNVTGGTVTIRNLKFTGFTDAAVSVANADVTFVECLFSDNVITGTTACGGAITALDANLSLNDCRFIGNQANATGVWNDFRQKVIGAGGAVSVRGNGMFRVDRSEFQWNKGTGRGGAIFCDASDGAVISNTLIANNLSDWHGGAIFMFDSAPLAMFNCTVAFNCALHAYGNVICAKDLGGNSDGGPNAHFFNTIMTNGFSGSDIPNTVMTNFHDCIVSDNRAAENGVNIVGFAKVHFEFSEAETAQSLSYGYTSWNNQAWRSLDWDFAITPHSYALDSGNNTNALTSGGDPIAEDLDGNDRFVRTVDIGAYEYAPFETSKSLSVPKNVRVVSAGANRMTVTWDAVQDALGYTVIVLSDDRIAVSCDADQTSITVKDLPYGKKAIFQVRAFGDGVLWDISELSESVTRSVCPMDADSDGRIGPADRGIQSSCWLLSEGAEGWDPRGDIDGDGRIGPLDRVFLSQSWLRRSDDPSLIYPVPPDDSDTAPWPWIPRIPVLQIPTGPNNPRNSEGDFLALENGDILFIYTHFYGNSGGDESTAYLASRRSSDGGYTWTEEDVLEVANEGNVNVMSVTCRTLADGNRALFYLVKETEKDCIPYVRFLNDDETWGERIRCVAETSYNVVNNDRVIQLESGRLLMPISRHPFEGDTFIYNGDCFCQISDDGGQTWRPGEAAAHLSGVVFQEPGLCELADGRILMYIRTNVGAQYFAYSEDGGLTWGKMFRSCLDSPQSPTIIKRIPGSDDLVAVGNPSVAGENLGRNAMMIARLSPDGSRILSRYTLEYPGRETSDWQYPAIFFTDDDCMLISYFSWPNGIQTYRVSLSYL